MAATFRPRRNIDFEVAEVKHQIAALMDNLAPHYDDDFWFLAYHAMALSEDGQLAVARAKIEQSLAANPNNAHGAHKNPRCATALIYWAL